MMRRPWGEIRRVGRQPGSLTVVQDGFPSVMALPSHFLSLFLFSLARSNVSLLTLGLCRSSGDEPLGKLPSLSRKTRQ